MRASSGTSSRLIANEMPGGIDAVMLTSEMRYGERFSRSDPLVISWSAVDLMIRSARTPGSIRSTTVETPRRAAPRALLRLLAQLLLRLRVGGGVRDHARSLLRLSGSGLGSLPGALHEAHVAESSERTGR